MIHQTRTKRFLLPTLGVKGLGYNELPDHLHLICMQVPNPHPAITASSSNPAICIIDEHSTVLLVWIKIELTGKLNDTPDCPSMPIMLEPVTQRSVPKMTSHAR